MSARNSRAAKAARRAVREGRYPAMPGGVCFGSSRLLAACYPELRYAEGEWTVDLHVPDAWSTIRHGWNVNTATGRIVDSTLHPDLIREAAEGRATLVYEEHPLDWPEDGTVWAQVTPGEVRRARRITAVMGPDAKRKALEQIGRELASLITYHEGEPYDPYDRTTIRSIRKLAEAR